MDSILYESYKYALHVPIFSILDIKVVSVSILSSLSSQLSSCILTNSFQLWQHRRTQLVLSSLATTTITNIVASANSNAEPMLLNLCRLSYTAYLTCAHYPVPLSPTYTTYLTHASYPSTSYIAYISNTDYPSHAYTAYPRLNLHCLHIQCQLSFPCLCRLPKAEPMPPT